MQKRYSQCLLASLTFLIFLLPGIAIAHDMTEIARERMASGGYLEVMWTGAEHMLSGYDHLLFLLGVMFFLTRFIDILKFVTAFTVGHTITLIFATFAGITANHYLIDAVIAVTVAYKGFENLDGFKRWFGVQAPNLLFMVFAFGLIHGFGLSARLQGVTLADDPDLLSKILLFNVGVELGQIIALLIMAIAITAWQKLSIWPTISRVSNTALIGAGAGLLVFQLNGFVQERQQQQAALQYEIFIDQENMMGQVRLSDQQPLAEAELLIESLINGTVNQVRTDSDGWFVFIGENGQTYSISAQGFSGADSQTRVTLGDAAPDHNEELHIPFYVFVALFMLLSVLPARMIARRI